MFSKYLHHYSSSVSQQRMFILIWTSYTSYTSKMTGPSILAESFFFFLIHSSYGVHRQIWLLSEVFSPLSWFFMLPRNLPSPSSHLYTTHSPLKGTKSGGSCTQVDKKLPLCIGIWCSYWFIRLISKHFSLLPDIFPFLLLNIWFKRVMGCLDPVFHKTILPIFSVP